MVLEAQGSHEIEEFHLRDIQKNVHDFKCYWTKEERHYKGVCMTQKEHLTDRQKQYGRRAVEKKHIKNQLGARFQLHLPELQLFQADGKIYEYKCVVQSINSGSLVSPHLRIPPSVKTHISHKIENDFMDSSLFTQEQEAHISTKSYKRNEYGKTLFEAHTLL